MKRPKITCLARKTRESRGTALALAVLAAWGMTALGPVQAAGVAGTVEFLPSQKTPSPPLVTVVPDETALPEKQALRLDPKASWAVQYQFDGRQLQPGCVYRLYAVARVKLLAQAKGPTFGVGVYDYVQRVAVLGCRLWQADEIHPDEWQTFDCGAWIPGPHEQVAWVGTEPGAMEYVDVARIYLVPQESKALDEVNRRLQEKPGCLALVARGGAYGLAAVELSAARGLSLEALISGEWDRNLWPNAWAGLVVAYHTPAGYAKRVVFPWGPGWRGKPETPGAPPDLSFATAGEALQLTSAPKDLWVTLDSPLDAAAPPDWDGRVWLGVLVKGLSTDQAALAAVITSRPWRDLGLWSNYTAHQLDYGMNYAGLFGATPTELMAAAAVSQRRWLEDNVARAAGGKLPPYVLRTESPQRHVFRDRVNQGWLQSTAVSQPVEMSLARREWESRQIALIPTSTNRLEGVAVSLGPLTGPGGAVWPAGDVRLWRVDYVEVKHPALGQAPGWWPDPLLPNAVFDVPAGENRAVWLTVRSRPETKPGQYRGTLTVQPANAPPTRLPVTITVWDFALPLRNHLRTDFWFQWGMLQGFYHCTPEQADALGMKFLDLLNDYRVGADFAAAPNDSVEDRGFTMTKEADGSYSFDFSRLDRKLARAFAGGQNVFNVALACWASQPWDYMKYLDKATGKEELYKVAGYEDPVFWKIYNDFLLAISKHMKAQGWWQWMIYQGWDEPQDTGKNFEQLNQLYGFVKQRLPDLPREITTTPTPKLYGSIDIWCPLDVFFNLPQVQERQAAGEQAWWYVIGNRFNHSLPLMDARMVFWTTWKYHLSGLLYWSTDAWMGPGETVKATNQAADPAQRWPHVPWELSYPDYSGQLCYPGPDGPLPSIRLEAIRDGIEDYEYLYLLRERLQALRKAGQEPAWGREADALLAVPDDFAPDKYTSLQDPDKLEAARRRLAEMILAAAPS